MYGVGVRRARLLVKERSGEAVEKRFYMATPQAMRAPPPPKGAGWSE